MEIQRATGAPWVRGEVNGVLCQGDTVRVGQRSRATLALVNDAVLRLDQNSAVRLINIAEGPGERSLLDILKGALQSFSRKPRQFEVSTPYLNGSIEGTEFVLRIEDDRTTLTVFEGVVVASNARGELSLAPGQAAVAERGKAPQLRIPVRPRDAAQWSLYYPPVLALNTPSAPTFQTLEAVPSGARDAGFYLNRAALLLSVGQVGEARDDIDQALRLDAAAGLAYALRAVIAVVQNEREQALADANQAVALNPESAAAHIALSYAQQAQFQIGPARNTMLVATERQPEDALAWARLAELELMLGNRKRARAAADKAIAIAPDLPRTQMVRGFAALAEFRNGDARAAFEKAIAVNSAEPLAHLGLGLSKISSGQLDAGRRDLEVAVGLDSNSALLHAYLGKAYFEEKRAPLDGEQFAIAKQLDPMDPTPFLYNAIRLQTENRPVEALQELDASIDLNDNRAAYRGRLLLDKDRAAQGTSLARVFNDLGFEKLGVNESTHSLALDPANASAHRFLSDTYRQIPRREISRVSELLQSQMLQDININPVQPSVATTDLNIITLGGPATPGFQEFTPLFQRNKAQLNVTGMVGNNDTLGGEAVVSGVYDRFSLSGGALGFDTDGFRPNNDLKHEIYDIYAQAAVSPQFNIQAEYGRRETDHGDLALNFDPNDFDPTFDRHFEVESARVGARITINSASNLLLSYIYSDRKDEQVRGPTVEQTTARMPEPIIPPPPPPDPPFTLVPVPATRTTASSLETEETADQYEAQYLFQSDQFNVTAGLAYAEVDQDFRQEDFLDFVSPPGAIPPTGSFVVPVRDEPTIEDRRGYVYGNVELPSTVAWTLGLSYQNYDEPAFDIDKFLPKLGVQWDINPSVRLRAAYFKVVKPALASNRTLEPTQVAGFNQFFDDANGTEFDHYGVGLDWRVKRKVFVGAELTRREIKSPVFKWAPSGQRPAVIEDRDEWYHRGYVYWTPTDRWSLSAEGIYDKYKSEESVDPNRPLKVRTVSFPVVGRYFHPSGFFGAVGVSYVDQEVRRSVSATHSDGNDDFLVADAAVGYRMPRRRGIASLAVQNLFDKDFNYQDNSFRTFQDEPSVGPYIPERTVMASITLNF